MVQMIQMCIRDSHLDNVYFTSELPQPNPDTGHLKIVKTIQGLTQEEATDYSIDVKIEGPNAYTTKTVTLNRFSWNEDKQAYTATYVEQNLSLIHIFFYVIKMNL